MKVVRKLHFVLNPVLYRYSISNIDTEKNVYIFSEGRGGSTWLQELLVSASDGLSIFEPFSGCNFGYNKRILDFPYPFDINSNFESSTAKPFMHDVVNVIRPGKRALQFNSFYNILYAKTAVIKFVNKGLILPWFLNEFDPKVKPIYLIRNPISIIKSRASYGYTNMQEEHSIDFSDLYVKFNSNHRLFKHISIFKELNTNYEIYIAEWAATLKYLFDLNIAHKVNFVHYEDLRARASCIEDLIKNVISNPDLNKVKIDKSSVSTKRIITRGKKIVFNNSDIVRFQNIVDQFLPSYRLLDK